MTTKKSDAPMEYDSNPFTLSFKGFGLFIDFARGVFIVSLVIGLFGFFMNIAQSFVGGINSNDTASNSTAAPSSDISTEAIIAILGVIIVAVVVIMAISLVINAVYKGFIAAGTIAASQKRKISVGEAFSEMGSRFGVLVWAHAIAWARIVGGYFLLIVPGIRAQLRYEPLVYIIMLNKDMSSKEAVEETKKLYSGHLMEVFGIYTVGAIIPVVGSSIAASGLTLSAQQIAAYHKAEKQTPKTHILNYLGLMLLGGIVLLFLLISIIIFAVVASSS